MGNSAVDHRQWQSLTTFLYLAERRSTSVFRPANRGLTKSSGAVRVAVLGLIGALLAIVIVRVLDTSEATPTILAIIMAILATLLLTEYGPAAVGSDLNGLSHYPIADHTFFLYRLTSLMRYTFSTTLPIAGPVPVIVAFEEGMAPALGWVLALVGLSIFVALSVGTMFGVISRLSSTGRLAKRIRDGLLAVVVTVYAAVLVIPIMLVDTTKATALASDQAFSQLWLPSAWFSGIIDLAVGSPMPLAFPLAAIAVGSIPAIFLAFRRTTFREIARQRESGSDSSVSPSTPLRKKERLLLLRLRHLFPAEFRVVRTLTKSQFRHQFRFRMRVLALVPLGIALLASHYWTSWEFLHSPTALMHFW